MYVLICLLADMFIRHAYAFGYISEFGDLKAE